MARPVERDHLIDGDAIANLGWRQGSFLGPKLATLACQHAPSTALAERADLLVLSSHDCDIVNFSLEKEPVVEVLGAMSTVIQNSPTCGHRKFPHPLVVKNDETSACGGCGQAVCGLSKALWARLRVHIAGSVHRLPAPTLPLWSA